MRRLLSLLLVWMLVAVAGEPVSAQESGFQVVAHADRALETIEKKHLSRLFLKKKTRWEDGSKIRPYEPAKGSSSREAFLSEVHGMDEEAYTKYWIKLVFAGRAQPPDELPVDELLETVAADPQAIGYVPAGTELPAGVKEIKVSESDD